MKVRRRHFLQLAALTVLGAMPRAGWAQSYPSRPITLVVFTPPGGAPDIVGRLVGQALSQRLGQAIVRCVERLAELLRAGAEDGTFDVADPDYTANIIWTQVLGTMHLARMRVGIRQAAPGIPALFEVEPERVVQTCVATALAAAGARP